MDKWFKMACDTFQHVLDHILKVDIPLIPDAYLVFSTAELEVFKTRKSWILMLEAHEAKYKFRGDGVYLYQYGGSSTNPEWWEFLVLIPNPDTGDTFSSKKSKVLHTAFPNTKTKTETEKQKTQRLGIVDEVVERLPVDVNAEV
jgi:hypothetical protein